MIVFEKLERMISELRIVKDIFEIPVGNWNIYIYLLLKLQANTVVGIKDNTSNVVHLVFSPPTKQSCSLRDPQIESQTSLFATFIAVDIEKWHSALLE